MFIEFTEIITGGLGTGSKRDIVLNLNKVISFREVSKTGGGTVFQTRRGDIQVTTPYKEVRKLLNCNSYIPLQSVLADEEKNEPVN
jgi:hypothetical protein